MESGNNSLIFPSENAEVKVMATDTNVTQAVPYFRVADMNTSLNFYQNGLGFELKYKWDENGRIEWCWLQLGGASIMLQTHPHTKFQDKKGVGVSVWFMCKDAIALYHEYKSKKIDVSEPFVGNGQWDVMVSDPDGYELHFESPTDVAEDTRYSDWVKTK